MNIIRTNAVESITRYWKPVIAFLFLGLIIFLIHRQSAQDRITISRKIYLGIQAEAPNQVDVSDFSWLLSSAGYHLDGLQKINNQLVATIQSNKSNLQADSQALMAATEILYRTIKTNYDNFSLNAKNLESKYIKIANSAIPTKKIYRDENSFDLERTLVMRNLGGDILKLGDLLEKRGVFQPAISKIEMQASVDSNKLMKLFFGYETTSLILCFLYLRYKNK